MSFVGNCWPGTSSWIDFLNPEARDYWVSMYAYSAFNGSTPTLAGTWNDMNEPALFNAFDSENSLPGDSVHIGTSGTVKHKAIHNAYGFLQVSTFLDCLYYIMVVAEEVNFFSEQSFP